MYFNILLRVSAITKITITISKVQKKFILIFRRACRQLAIRRLEFQKAKTLDITMNSIYDLDPHRTASVENW